MNFFLRGSVWVGIGGEGEEVREGEQQSVRSSGGSRAKGNTDCL